MSAPIPSRQRKWAPKVKTGCLTCRLRKIKCDETRPSCKKCVSGRRICDGYADRDYTLQKQQLPMAMLPNECSSDALDLLLLAKRANRHVLHVSEYITIFISEGQQISTYSEHLPSRSGYSATLDSAVKCAVAAFRLDSVPIDAKGDAMLKSFSLYAKALQQLQLTLTDPKDSRTAETLSATLLLQVFESLISIHGQGWLEHMRGAARLLQYRTPSSFTSEFERSMLLTLVPTLVGEAFHSGKACFLDSPEWINVLQYAVVPGREIDRSEILISFYENTIPAPRIMAECTAFINNPPPDDDSTQHQAIMMRIEYRRDCLIRWRYRWSRDFAFISKASIDYSHENQLMSKLIEIYTVYQDFLTKFNRMYVAFGGPHALIMENQARKVATDTVNSRWVQPNVAREACTHFSLTSCQAALDTADEWDVAEGSMYNIMPSGRRIVKPKIFSNWIYRLGIAPAKSNINTAKYQQTEY